LELQTKARRAVADVVTARKRIELLARQLGSTVGRLEEQARAALQQGRQEVAREAVAWRATLQGELTELERQTGSLAGDEGRLRQVASQVDLHLHQLRVRRDSLRASYAAARARADIGRALAEARVDHSDVLQALEEAGERVARTRALADALEGMAARGGPRATTPGLPAPAVRSDAEVDAELTRMEEDLLWGPKAPGEHAHPAPPEGPA
jgi:phage shock protein A